MSFQLMGQYISKGEPLEASSKDECQDPQSWHGAY